MLTSVKTTCCYCGVGCGLVVRQDRAGRLSAEGDADYPVNRGLLCSKGRYLHQTAMDRSDRLLFPQMRWSRAHPMERVSWDVALDRAAAVFKTLIAKHGPESVAFYVSGQLLTEEYYVANKLMKGFIGANNIDTNSRLCMASAATGYRLALGDDACPVSYEDIEQCDCFFITGSNTAWCHPILFQRLEKQKAERPQTRIIVVDPRRTQTCAIADLHLQIQPGTDVTLYNAIARHLIESDQLDHAFVAAHTSGLEALRRQVSSVSIAEAAAICNVPAADIIVAADMIGRSPTFISMWAMGLNQSVIGTNKNLALINLSLLTGKIGKPGCGPFSLTGQSNAMGGREVGGMAHLLAAHRSLSNPAHRAEVAAFWGVEKIAEKPGLSALELVDALETGTVKAVWIICTNPAVSMPDAAKLERALEKTKFVIVQDMSHRADTLRYADLVLPAATWLEKQGTMTNSERRISYLPKLIEPPGESIPDSFILCRFAHKMGWKAAFDYRDESEIFDEYARLTTGTVIDISGLSYDKLKRERSIQWPCPAPDHAGTPRLFATGRFYTESGRANLSALPGDNPSEPVSTEFPLVLTTGRIRDQWHTMTRTGKVARLRQHLDVPFLEIHPEDAAPLGLQSGDTASVSSRRGEVRARATVTDTIKRGVVFLPMHWGKTLNGQFGRANNVTNPIVDPQSKQPDFKFCAVQVRRLPTPAKKIVIVGAGAAARQFVMAYREHNQTDALHVFGREPHLFYNRILLPHYVANERNWESLLTSDEAMLRKLDVAFHHGVEITAIDRAARTVTDADGTVHAYDRLVLGMGSRAFVPPGVPVHLRGVFTLRSKDDGDRIRTHLAPGARLLIMGGGLLGLEMAAAMHAAGFRCTLIDVGPRPMRRQLDVTGSALLRDELEERGITCIFGDAVTAFFGAEQIESVKTQGGKHIACDALLVAVGTRPNIELGVAAGIAAGRGLSVDDHLLTSDPNIYALGEVAEHRGKLYGFTQGANEQADVAAAHAAGDIWATYKGSTMFNILKLHGLDVIAMGQTDVPPDHPGYEEITLLDRERRYYKKCVVHQNRLVGAVLIGDKSEFAAFKKLMDDDTELDAKRDELLRSGNRAPQEAPIGRLVCTCNTVGVGNIENLITGGCSDFRTLCEKSQAGTGCGSCRPEVRMILDAKLAALAEPLNV